MANSFYPPTRDDGRQAGREGTQTVNVIVVCEVNHTNIFPRYPKKGISILC
jgi:hypothetical protein